MCCRGHEASVKIDKVYQKGRKRDRLIPPKVKRSFNVHY